MPSLALAAWLVLAQLDGGAAPTTAALSASGWRKHPRIAAVRSQVSELDGRVGPTQTRWFCAVRSRAAAPRTAEDLKHLEEVELYGPDYEVAEVVRSAAPEGERTSWRWVHRSVSEVEIRDEVEVTRHARRGRPLFVHLREGFLGLGAYSLEVRAYHDDAGRPFWWGVVYVAGQGPGARLELAGPVLPALPDGTDQPPVNTGAVLRWMEPERVMATMKPCTAEGAARLRALAESREPRPTDLALLRSVWTAR